MLYHRLVYLDENHHGYITEGSFHYTFPLSEDSVPYTCTRVDEEHDEEQNLHIEVTDDNSSCRLRKLRVPLGNLLDTSSKGSCFGDPRVSEGPPGCHFNSDGIGAHEHGADAGVAVAVVGAFSSVAVSWPFDVFFSCI